MWRVAAPCLQKERRLLENRRLDLDICKARLKKAKQAEAKAAVRAPHTPCSCHRRRGGELHMTATWKRNCRKILFVNNCIVAFNTELNHEQRLNVSMFFFLDRSSLEPHSTFTRLHVTFPPPASDFHFIPGWFFFMSVFEFLFFFCLLDDCIAHVWLCSSLLLSFVGCTWFSGDKASKLCSVCQCFSGKHPPGGASFTCSLGTWNAWLCWFRPGVGQLFDCDRYLCLYLSDS